MSKRKGKKYVPKPIVTPAMRSSPNAAMQVDLKLMAYQALDAILMGWGDKNMYDYLCAVVNLSTVLAENGKGKEYIDVCQAGLDALRRTGERFVATGKYGFDGDGYQELKACLDLHSQQIEISTRLQISDAIFEVERRIRKQQKTNENIA